MGWFTFSERVEQLPDEGEEKRSGPMMPSATA
jgi:hypothetical protein